MKSNFTFNLNLASTWRQDLLPDGLLYQLKDLQRKALRMEHGYNSNMERMVLCTDTQDPIVILFLLWRLGSSSIDQVPYLPRFIKARSFRS